MVQEDIDHVVGAVFAADLFHDTSLKAISRATCSPCRALAAQRFSPERHVHDRRDEYGGTAGLVTIEGWKSSSARSATSTTTRYRTIDARTVVADARAEMVHVAAALNLDAPESNPTVAGFILDEIGRIPRAQEQLLIGKFRVTVLQATPNHRLRPRRRRDDG